MRPRSSKFEVGASFQTCCRASGFERPTSTRPAGLRCSSIQPHASMTPSRTVASRPSLRTTVASRMPGSRCATAATSQTKSGVESDEKYVV